MMISPAKGKESFCLHEMVFTVMLVTLSTTSMSCSNPNHAPSAWAFASESFSDAIFDDDFQAQHFTPKAIESLTFLKQIERTSYEFLQLSDLTYSDGPVQTGRVAVRLDGWPVQLSFTMTTTESGHRISRVGSGMSVRHLLVLLGHHGLATAVDALPWSGGLSGRDIDGKPNAAVVVVAVGGYVYIDGQSPVKYEQQAVTAAIRAALDARTNIAEKVFATYQPRVAIAMTRRAPALMSTDLTQWAFTAGARSVRFLVKGAQGRPSYIDIGRSRPSSIPKVGRVFRLMVTENSIETEQYPVGTSPRIQSPKIEISHQRCLVWHLWQTGVHRSRGF